MNEYVAFGALVIAVIGLAKVINRFIPHNHDQMIEEKYNK